MKERITLLKSIAIITVLGFALAGCAAVEKNDASDTEEMLAAAGFKMRPADTPEKLAHLQSLTQRKLISHDRDGKVYFVFADADFCKCLYVGNQMDFQRYQNLSVSQNMAQMNAAAPMDWGMWGPLEQGW